MSTIEIINDLYPETIEKIGDEEFFSYQYDYTPMIESFGEVIIRVNVRDYQGDTWALLKRDCEYGYLQFGWGSCSGCDALQRCESVAEIAELYDRLAASIVWRTKEETIKWFKEHDWEGDYCYYEEEFKSFLDKVNAYFGEASNA
jgi:hypothetical protein